MDNNDEPVCQNWWNAQSISFTTRFKKNAIRNIMKRISKEVDNKSQTKEIDRQKYAQRTIRNGSGKRQTLDFIAKSGFSVILLFKLRN